MKKEFDIAINVKNTAAGKDVFAKTYRIALWEDFVGSKSPKEHNLTTHIEGLVTQLKLNCIEQSKLPLAKWDVYVTSYTIGAGSEILSNRPSIIYKSSQYTKGDDVTVIPLTSAVREKLTDAFDIFVPKDDENKLFQNSYARVRQLRAVSVKRIGKLLGTITNEQVKAEINAAVVKMLGTAE